jgi:hypothetical protein
MRASMLLARIALTLAVACPVGELVAAPARNWTTADSIAVRYLVEGISEPSALNPSGMAGPADGSGAFQWSPGNRYFFFITRYGDLGCDCNRYTLSLYDARKLSAVLGSTSLRSRWSPAPLKEVTFETTASNEFMVGIYEPRWADADTLEFIGVRDGQRQVFRLTASTGALSQLTHVSAADDPERPAGDDRLGTAAGVSAYQLRGETLIYNTVTYVRYPPIASRYPAVSLAESRLGRLHFFGRYTADLYVSRPAGSAPRHVARCNQSGTIKFFSLSPDGTRAITTCQFTEALSPDGLERQAKESVQYLLVDTRSGSTREIARTLVRGSAPSAVWSEDGERVALLNAFAPTSDGCASDSALHVMSYAVGSNEASCVVPMSGVAVGGGAGAFKISVAKWRSASTLSVTATAGREVPPVEIDFEARERRWVRKSETAATRPPEASSAKRPVQVEVLRSANEPWKVVARSAGHAIPLSLPDPALADVRIVPMTPFNWRVGTVEDAGGLYVPVHREPKSRVPLVIQVGHYVPYRFLPDGSASTAYAAQPLVAQGMAVLNIDVISADLNRQGVSVDEALSRRVDAAVDVLGRAGIIDPHKVGLIGFSHSGFRVHYLATHPGTVRPAAGVVADAFMGSYGQYTFLDTGLFDSPSSRRQLEALMGGTFWEAKDEWLRKSPMFNVDRVTAAMLFSSHGATFAAAAGEPIAAYRLTGKPFEYLLFPKGAHQLQTPVERKASMDASVAWMAFWLQGREIAGMQTQETYARWQRMKDAAAHRP